MAIERFWDAVPVVPFTSNGTSNGIITIKSTAGFHVKQTVILQSNTIPQTTYEVKRIISPTQMVLGEVGKSITDRSDLTSFLTINAPVIFAQEQPKNKVPKDDQYDATYAREPIVARRVFNVDEYGRPYNVENPIPVQGNSDVSANVLVNLKTIELFGLPTTDYLLADDEIVITSDGTLVKSN